MQRGEVLSHPGVAVPTMVPDGYCHSRGTAADLSIVAIRTVRYITTVEDAHDRGRSKNTCGLCNQASRAPKRQDSVKFECFAPRC